MAINFFKWLIGKTAQPSGKTVEIDCTALLEAAQDFTSATCVFKAVWT